MDNQTVKHLWALREVNKGLILGLKTALSVMEGWDDISPARRQSTMASVRTLIAQSEEEYGTEPTKH
jgi:hypothetical protein